MLQADLATSRLLAHPGGRRIWVLDATAAALWDLQAAGWAREALVGLLATRFGLDPAAARAHLDALNAQWDAAGLSADAAAPDAAPMEDLPPLPPPHGGPPPPGAWRLWLAQRPLRLVIGDPGLRNALAPLLAPLRVPPSSPDHPGDRAPPDDQLVLAGPATHWTLTGNGHRLDTGRDGDAALVATLHALTEFGCRTRERLLVVHGAGLIAPDGHALLLIAPGGAGKSTLTAALNAAGWGLLSDDVVPVTPAGALVGLGLPLCLKSGSWPVLAGCRPDLEQAPVVHRYGQAVRFLPPAGPPPTATPRPARFVFPQYRPGQAPGARPLSPALALQGLIAAEAVIRDLSQAKLTALARWVEAVPAVALSYPDLASALALVRALE